MTLPAAFHDLPTWAFPFTMEVFDPETGETLWSEQIEGPGAVHVPGFAPRKVGARIIGADGSVHEVLEDD